MTEQNNWTVAQWQQYTANLQAQVNAAQALATARSAEKAVVEQQAAAATARADAAEADEDDEPGEMVD